MNRHVHVDDVPAFTHEADVLVVGFGCAGGAAALEARRLGADVVVLERLSAPGGSSAQSGGELYLGGGTALQRALGFDDDAASMAAYLVAALGPHADEEKIRAYSEGSPEHFEWFRALGITFEESLFDAPSWLPPTRDGLMWLGENAWPFTEIARPVPRGHRPATEGYGGWMLMERLTAACADAGVQTHTDTRAAQLVVDDGGRVVGLLARHFGEEVSYRARRGVVLTTGGFVDDADMVAHHAPEAAGHGKVSDGGDDGSGIRMGQSLGAATRRMSALEVSYLAMPSMVAHGMLVNARGERFVNEDVYPGVYSHAAFHQPGPCWVILDEAGLEAVGAEAAHLTPSFAAETVAELEHDLGMPAGALVATVEAYNRDAAVGADRLHKSNRWVRELTGPFIAFDPRLGLGGTERGTGFNCFTLGGLHTRITGEVLDVHGDVVPGLFAAGRASSGMHGYGYVSGTSLGDGTFFGRAAGVTAASS